jgi:ATPase family associated with various cellular activities (AAA)
LRLRELVVIGKYRRFDPIGRSMLRNSAQEIMRQLSSGGDWHRNFLIWAPPGTGKSYFVEQVAHEVPGVDFLVVNLAQLAKPDWESRLREVSANSTPTLCLVDEIDARRDESWPYEILFPYLDLSKSRPIVFVLVGSGGEGKEALVRLIQDRPKGSDLIDRVPARQRMEVPPPDLGDRLLILVSALLEHRSGDPINEIEKLALYYALAREDIKSSRQSEDFAIEVLSRVPANQSQIFYDTLFSSGDRDNQQFYAEHLEIARSLQHRFLQIIPDTLNPN